MPRMSGPELAARLAPIAPGLRGLYMSGYTDDKLTDQGTLGPEVQLIENPFDRDELLRQVRAVLDDGGADAGGAVP